jgi:hypothetical protein
VANLIILISKNSEKNPPSKSKNSHSLKKILRIKENLPNFATQQKK